MLQQALWRGLLKGFSQLLSVFIEASQNFVFNFLHNKAVNKFTNYQRIYKKNSFDFKTFKKLFISWHNPVDTYI